MVKPKRARRAPHTCLAPGVRGRLLVNLLHNCNLVAVNTLDTCKGADATFVSYDGIYKLLIDHIVIARENIDTVISCEVVDDKLFKCVKTSTNYQQNSFSG